MKDSDQTPRVGHARLWQRESSVPRPGSSQLPPESETGAATTDRAGSETTHDSKAPHARAKRPSILIAVFVISLAIPILIFVGPLRMTPYRLLLVILFIPCLVAWLTGNLGRVRVPDFLFLLYCAWATTALIVNHGFEFAFEPSGILLVETFGTYLLARWLIRDSRSFLFMVKLLYVVILVLAPFAIVEAFTSVDLPLRVISGSFDTFPEAIMQPRWGFDRAQGPFEHPILFGVFCSSAFSLSIFVLGMQESLLKKWAIASPPAVATFMSFSSGPLSTIVIQSLLIGWDSVFRRVRYRWHVLAGIFVFVYVTIDMLSNRAPFQVLVSYFAFSESTGYDRLRIWQFGSAEVLRHPLFGIGLGEWTRPSWMSSSVDMFWLVHALRYGIPAAALFSLGALVILFQLGRAKLDAPEIRAFRKGLIITLVGLSMAGWMVHFWNATYCLYVFLLGSGVWMIESPKADGASSRGYRRHEGWPSGDRPRARRQASDVGTSHD